MPTFIPVLAALAAGALAATLTHPSPAAAEPPPSRGAAGAVFVATNHNNTTDPTEPANQVAYYRRAADGTLTLTGRYDTGGQGSGPSQRFAGDGLGSGGSVTLSGDHKWLLVTNAGSDTVSVFRVRRDSLRLTDVEPTGDSSPGHRFPNSVTIDGNMVYVLNAGDDASITGFRLSGTGRLRPIPGSTRELDANQPRFAPDPLSDPAQVAFTPDGSQLVVSIKDGPAAGFVPGFTPTGPGRVLVFGMRGRVPSAGYTRTDFDNRGPFGFSFDDAGNLVIAQFVGGGLETVGGREELTGAVGSYRINDNGTLTPLTGFAGDHQVDTCWVVNNGRYAFGSNYTSGTISSFRIAADGTLSLLDPVAASTDHPGNTQGSTPLDLGISPDGRFLYLVEPGAGKVGAWRIGPDGALTRLGEYDGLPRTVDGDHAPVDFGAGGSPAGIAVL
ncbi:MAG TPA: beta-propeller fold lactonase family protein [Actinomycetota bacterium]|nr:beta-propeller fold lactonase family protein [Actinomycetota bacterium]